MKLPGITYGPVQSLGREDIGAPLRVAGAVSQAAQQWSQVAGNIYDQESVSQAEKATLDYTAAMDAWQAGQNPYQTDAQGNVTEGTWIRGAEIFQQSEDAIANSVAKQHLKTPLARRLFEAEHNKLKLKNNASWNGKLEAWRMEDQFVTMSNSIQTHLENKQFESARRSVAKGMAVNIIGRKDANELVNQIDYQEHYHNFSVGVDSIETPQQAVQLRSAVEADGKLRPQEKNKLDAAISEVLVNNYLEEFHNEVQRTEAVAGLPAAVQAGQNRINGVVRTTPEGLGGDSKFKESVTSQLISALSRYQGQLVKRTAEMARIDDVECYASGRCLASPQYNDNVHNDFWASRVMGWLPDGGGTDYDRTSPGARTERDLLTDPQVGAATVEFAAISGFMPKQAAQILEASLFDRNGENSMQALNIYHNLYKQNPYAVYRRKNDDLLGVVAMADMLGGSPEAYGNALNYYRQLSDMPQAEKTRLETLGKTKEFNDFFDDNYKGMLKDEFGRDVRWWRMFTSSRPEVSENHKHLIKTMAQKYMPFTNGNMELAMRTAMHAMKSSYGGSNATGDYKFMQHPPDKIVTGGEVNDGQWMPRQMKEEITKEYGGDIEFGELIVEPVVNFDVNDATYNVFDIDPETGLKRFLGPFKYDYTATVEYEQELREREKQQQRNREIRDSKQRAAAWRLENGTPAEREERLRGTIGRQRLEAREDVYGDIEGWGEIPWYKQAAGTFGRGLYTEERAPEEKPWLKQLRENLPFGERYRRRPERQEEGGE